MVQVIPPLYKTYSKFKWNPIKRADLNEEKFNNIASGFNSDLKNLLNDITTEYFGLTAYELERITR